MLPEFLGLAAVLVGIAIGFVAGSRWGFRAEDSDVLEAERARVEGAAKLSHEHMLVIRRELRLPLRTLGGLARSLQIEHEGPLSPRRQRITEDLVAATERLERISTTWLELARVETGRIEVVPRATNLREALDDLVARFDEADRGVRLDVQVADACIAIDPRRVRQVVFQLVDFAHERSPDAGVVGLSAWVVDEELRVDVEWEGRIGDGRHLIGSDVGLSLASSLVELLGGRLRAEGSARFEVRLPLLAARSEYSAAKLGQAEILARMVADLAAVVEITDKNGVLEYVNPAFEQTFGWSVDEALGRTPRELVRSAVHDERFWSELWECIASGQVWRGRLVSRTRDGDLVPMDTMISPIRDDMGALTHFVAIKRNVSEHFELQSQLRQVERVAAGVAHQINNPLTVLMANVAFLSQTEVVADEDRELLDEIGEACGRIRDVVGDLRRFSSTHGEQALVDVRVLLDHVVELAAPTAASRAHLERDYEPVPMVLGDRSQLVQVFQHVVSNALQAIEPGSPEQHLVGVRCYTDDGGACVVEVSDTGPGIADGDRERVFQPFFTRRQGGGRRGMGLAISTGFVRRHGGDITLVDVDAGATFRIRLPAWQPVVASMQHRELALRPLHILAVDDDADLLQVLRTALREHTVICATSAAEATTLLEGGSFDLVLCDLMMRGGSGMELFGSVPDEVAETFTFMTGADLLPEIERFLAETEAAVLRKPFGLGDLRRFVRAWAATRVSADGS